MPISQKLVWQGVREIAQEKIQVTTFSRNNYGQSIVMIIFNLMGHAISPTNHRYENFYKRHHKRFLEVLRVHIHFKQGLWFLYSGFSNLSDYVNIIL